MQWSFLATMLDRKMDLPIPLALASFLGSVTGSLSTTCLWTPTFPPAALVVQEQEAAWLQSLVHSCMTHAFVPCKDTSSHMPLKTQMLQCTPRKQA